MILAADAEGCVRERSWCWPQPCRFPTRGSVPPDREEAARQKHARFADEQSDFVSYLNLWGYLREQRNQLSRQCLSPNVPRRVLAPPADPGNGRIWWASCAASRAIWVSSPSRTSRPTRPGACGADGRFALAHRAARRRYSRVRRGTQREVRPRARIGTHTKRPPQWIVVADLVETGRCSDASRPASNRSPSNALRAISCSAPQ